MTYDYPSIAEARETYIDNGDGTYRVETNNQARWYSGVEVIYGPHEGAFRPARWRRVARWWFDARCWMAEKILRVPVGDL